MNPPPASAMQFPSGKWTGFFTYHGAAHQFPMDLLLEFQEGKMTGEGNDAIGPFIIFGAYSSASGECSWIKQYVGQHAVDYRGFKEAKDIWGTWTLPGAKGGFRIWPLEEETPAHNAQTVEEQPQPETLAPISVPAAETVPRRENARDARKPVSLASTSAFPDAI